MYIHSDGNAEKNINGDLNFKKPVSVEPYNVEVSDWISIDIDYDKYNFTLITRIDKLN